MKVLILSDSFGDEDNIDTYNQLCEKDDIYFEGIEWIQYVPDFKADVVLIDYGSISDYPGEEVNIKTLQQYHLDGVKMFWYGGLCGLNKHYHQAVVEQFPKQRFLHKIEECPLRDWRWFLNEIKEEIQNERRL